MKAYWIITVPALIAYYLCIAFLEKGEFGMNFDNATVALLVAIIGLIGSVLGNIIVNHKGWKSSEKMIGNSKSNKTLTAMLGNDGADRISLSDDHREIKKEIITAQNKISQSEKNITYNMSEYSKAIEALIKPSAELLIRMDEREQIAEAVRKAREELLTPTQYAMKTSIDNIIAMSENWQENNAELIRCKKKIQNLRLEILEKDNLIEQKTNEICFLKSELDKAHETIYKYDREEKPPTTNYQSFPETEEGDDEQDWELER